MVHNGNPILTRWCRLSKLRPWKLQNFKLCLPNDDCRHWCYPSPLQGQIKWTMSKPRFSLELICFGIIGFSWCYVVDIVCTMVTSSNGHIFCVTGHLCGEFTGHRWIPHTKTSDAEIWCFSLICVWVNGCVNNREAGVLTRHRAQYDVIVMPCVICNSSKMHLIDVSASQGPMINTAKYLGYTWLR